jgi:mannose-6-phosphate isomerase-like protein (cupin superfamily)
MIDPDGLQLNLQAELIKSNEYRKILYTDTHLQIVIMTLEPNEVIPFETHKGTQIINLLSGSLEIKLIAMENSNDNINRREITLIYQIYAGETMIIPAGFPHQVTNVGSHFVKFSTIYSPPEH